MMGFFLSLSSHFKYHFFRYLITQSKIASVSFHPIYLFYFHHSHQYHLVFSCLFIVWLLLLAFKPYMIRTCVLGPRIVPGMGCIFCCFSWKECCLSFFAFLLASASRSLFPSAFPLLAPKLLFIPQYLRGKAICTVVFHLGTITITLVLFWNISNIAWFKLWLWREVWIFET